MKLHMYWNRSCQNSRHIIITEVIWYFFASLCRFRNRPTEKIIMTHCLGLLKVLIATDYYCPNKLFAVKGPLNYNKYILYSFNNTPCPENEPIVL